MVMPEMNGVAMVKGLRVQGFSQPAILYSVDSPELNFVKDWGRELKIAARINKPFAAETSAAAFRQAAPLGLGNLSYSEMGKEKTL